MTTRKILFVAATVAMSAGLAHAREQPINVMVARWERLSHQCYGGSQAACGKEKDAATDLVGKDCDLHLRGDHKMVNGYWTCPGDE